MKVKNFLKGYPDDIAVFVHSLPKLLLSAYYLYPKCSSSIMKEDIKQMLPVRTNHNCIFYDMVSYVIVSSMVYVIVSFETERGTGVGAEQKAPKKFRAFHIVIRHSSSIPERFLREDYKTNELI